MKVQRGEYEWYLGYQTAKPKCATPGIPVGGFQQYCSNLEGVLVETYAGAVRSFGYKHRDTFSLFALAFVCILPGMYLVTRNAYSPLTFLIMLATFLITYKLSLNASLILAIGYLFLLGDVRRIVNNYAGFPTLDPLLLVGPLFTMVVALPLIFGARVSDRLSKAVLGLMALMAFEIINPRQGGIVVGFTGALFFLIPISWFWIGRQFGTGALLLRIGMNVVVPLGFLAALFGFYQTYLGTLPWQEAWIKHALVSGYSALSLGNGHIRSFGFSVNSVEYGTLLMMASVLCSAAILAGKRVYGLLLPFLLAALVLASMRGLILRTLLAVVIMWAVRGPTFRSWVTRLAFGGLLGFGLLAYSVRHAASDSGGSGGGNATSSANLATSHVANGLAHPLDPKYSTAGLHVSMFMSGITAGIRNPLGMGLGITTLGAGKFAGSAYIGSTEVDISDTFEALGVIGGVIYLMTIALAFIDAGKIILQGYRDEGYLVLGLFVGMIGSWVPLGQYAAGPFMWFCVGCLAKKIGELEVAQAEQSRWEDLGEDGQELLGNYATEAFL